MIRVMVNVNIVNKKKTSWIVDNSIVKGIHIGDILVRFNTHVNVNQGYMDV